MTSIFACAGPWGVYGCDFVFMAAITACDSLTSDCDIFQNLHGGIFHPLLVPLPVTDQISRSQWCHIYS